MGGEVMPRGASAKREREYEELKDRMEEEGRYKGREEEVAARIVNKQRAEYGETKKERAKDEQGKSPDKDLPIANYQHMTVDEIAGRLSQLSRNDVNQIKDYEQKHKNRKTLIEELNRRLQEA
jgi:hypothetical protein